MVGRTNAGGGGSASQWYAYIQVSTDANAIITAVNQAGNSYTRTADSSGSLIIVVGYPGTYTISRTGATSQTVVVADYGVAYPVSIYAAFTGKLIENGVEVVPFDGEAITSYSLPQKIPTITHEVTVSGGISYNCVGAELTNGAGMYLCRTPVSISNFTKISVVAEMLTTYSFGVCVVEEGVTGVPSKTLSFGSDLGVMYTRELAFSTYGINTSKKYRFGIYISDYINAKGYIHSLKLL